MRPIAAGIAAMALIAAGAPACAWGDMGHKVVGIIAYKHLTPTTKAKVDAMLASDTDALTAPDFASRTTWADKYCVAHRETAAWHFNDIEIDHPDISTACFGFPPMQTGQVASQGPANDCAVNKITQFATELHDPATPPAERLLALKFVMHFVADMHQPLHSADDNDRGGNCIALAPSPDGKVTNLHAFWDVTAVEALVDTPAQIAVKLDHGIKKHQRSAWAKGDPKAWALEVFAVATRDVYAVPSKPTCAAPGSVTLTPAYQAQATVDAARQLEIAEIRLAYVLNRALGSR